jgi:hypothetical protein
MSNDERVPGSFRDPAGFVYRRDGVLYRQLNASAQPLWESFEASGLMAELIEHGLLVAHDEVDIHLAAQPPAWKVIRPEPIPFVSFPYEWSVAQLMDAALLTLEVQRRAVLKGQSLRDASAYNVQFRQGRPVFIDSLSFGPWEEGSPWIAYGQFCQHFLAPLALQYWVDPGLRLLLRTHIDGIPLPLAAKMLPARSWMRLGIASHLHLHARASKQHASSARATDDGSPPTATVGSMTQTAMLGMLDSLKSTIVGLDAKPKDTEWGDYYSATNYSDAATDAKAEAVTQGLTVLKEAGLSLDSVWDLGANTGRYSRLAHDAGAHVVSFDIDEAAVDRHWRAIRSTKAPHPRILPLLADLTNPSPSLGWAHKERPSMSQRGPADVVFALALIHHLALSNNTPLEHIAAWFSTLCRGALVEMVPKDDSQVRRLLATREDIFPTYTFKGFEEAFGKHFSILSKQPIAHSTRVLYVLKSLTERG